MKETTVNQTREDHFGFALSPERMREVLAAYAEVQAEIEKLRSLDLGDVHPAIVFEPTAPYRSPR